MQKELIEKLESIGLSNKESKVYLALLEEGSATAEKAATKAKLNRSTTYVQIKSLMDNGLVTTYKKGKKTYFSAESPAHLERILEYRKAELDQKLSDANLLVPNLMKIFSDQGGIPAVRVFHGKEGLAAMRRDILLKKPKEVLIKSNYDQIQEIFTKDELFEFTKKRENLKIKSFVLYKSSGKEDIKPFKYQKLRRLPDSVKLNTDLYVYNDTVSFASVRDGIVGVTIQNASIAETMKELYKCKWESIGKK